MICLVSSEAIRKPAATAVTIHAGEIESAPLAVPATIPALSALRCTPRLGNSNRPKSKGCIVCSRSKIK